MKIDIDKISGEYESTGSTLINRFLGGPGASIRPVVSDHDREAYKRIRLIILRVGVEFLIKAIYLMDGYNIYWVTKSLRNKYRKKWKFDEIGNIGESDLDLTHTASFGEVLNNFKDIPSVKKNIDKYNEISNDLEEIQKLCNPAVHRSDMEEEEPKNVSLIKSRLSQILEHQKQQRA